MKRLTLLAVIAALFVSAILPAQAQSPTYTKITYIHSDADGSPFAATDEQGNLEWHIDHYPYGDEYRNTEIARKSNLSFAGKAYDEEIGLSYFGGRWYDPAAGRFMSIDPAPVDPEDYRTFNRYAYGFNNPYKYVDPDGNLPILIPIAIWAGKALLVSGAGVSGYSIGSEGYALYSGRKTVKEAARDGAIGVGSGLLFKGVGAGLFKLGSQAFKRVGRHMSPDELAKMRKTGRVQEGGGGQTRVADPADPNTYKNAPKDDVYVEFDVPASRVLPHSKGTGRIPGPNSLDSKVAGKNSADFEMPKAKNIEVKE